MSVLAALTGWADWSRLSEPGTQARRTINAHAITMITVTVVVLVNLCAPGVPLLRIRCARPAIIVVLSVLCRCWACRSARRTAAPSSIDYGFNVETAGDSPVWDQSEDDIFPGQHGESQ